MTGLRYNLSSTEKSHIQIIWETANSKGFFNSWSGWSTNLTWFSKCGTANKREQQFSAHLSIANREHNFTSLGITSQPLYL